MITPLQLVLAFNKALAMTGLEQYQSQGPEDTKNQAQALSQRPALTCKVSPDYKFAFVDMAHEQACTDAVTHLNGMMPGQYSIKVSRAKNQAMAPAPEVPAHPLDAHTSLPFSIVLPGAGSFLPITATAAYASGPGGTLLQQNSSSSSLTSLVQPNGGSAYLLGGATGQNPSSCVMLSLIPAGLDDDQVRELIAPFGALKAFNLVPPVAGGSTQTAVFQFEDGPSAAGQAVTGLSQVLLAGLRLQAQLLPEAQAQLLLRPAAPTTMGGAAVLETTVGPRDVLRVPGCTTEDQIRRLNEDTTASAIVLGSMATEQDLTDQEAYLDLVEDVAEECNKFGMVKEVVVPREGGQVTGANSGSRGFIYVRFTGPAGAEAARKALQGRRFGGREVQANAFPDALIERGVFVVPEDYWTGGVRSTELD